jgi:hypothetical protein
MTTSDDDDPEEVRRSCIQAVALAAVTCQHAPPLLAHSTRALRAGSATGGHPEAKMMVGSLWGPTGHAPSAVDAPLRPNTQVLISPPMGASWVQPLSLLFASLLDSWSTLSYVSLCPYIYVSCDLAVARALDAAHPAQCTRLPCSCTRSRSCAQSIRSRGIGRPPRRARGRRGVPVRVHCGLSW